MIVKTGPALIACLLLVLAILLELALVIHPPRLAVFPLRMTQPHERGVPPSYIGLALELDPTQVEAAKARMLRKVEEARSILAVAEGEEQEAEGGAYAATEADIAAKARSASAAEQADMENYAWNARIGSENEVSSWRDRIVWAQEEIDKAKLALGALGEHASLAELREAGRLANESIRLASGAETEMRLLKENWE